MPISEGYAALRDFLAVRLIGVTDERQSAAAGPLFVVLSPDG
jgi:hypothetical protein